MSVCGITWDSCTQGPKEWSEFHVYYQHHTHVMTSSENLICLGRFMLVSLLLFMYTWICHNNGIESSKNKLYEGIAGRGC